MYKPKKDSLRDQICRHILAQGKALDMAEIAEAFPGQQYSTITSSVFNMKHRRALTETNGDYWLANHILRHYGIDAPEDPKPEIKIEVTFKPLSDKHKFWLAPRREPLRDISFKSGSAHFQPLFGL